MKDATGLPIAYVYFEDEPRRQTSMKRMSRDEAFLTAVNIAKLPRVPRAILKDIPRPPELSEPRIGVFRVPSELVKPLPRPLNIPTVMTLRTLAGVSPSNQSVPACLRLTVV